MSGTVRVVVHEPTLEAAGAERVGAVVLAAVRAEARRLEGADGADGADGAAAGPDAADLTPP